MVRQLIISVVNTSARNSSLTTYVIISGGGVEALVSCFKALRIMLIFSQVRVTNVQSGERCGWRGGQERGHAGSWNPVKGSEPYLRAVRVSSRRGRASYLCFRRNYSASGVEDGLDWDNRSQRNWHGGYCRNLGPRSWSWRWRGQRFRRPDRHDWVVNHVSRPN